MYVGCKTIFKKKSEGKADAKLLRRTQESCTMMQSKPFQWKSEETVVDVKDKRYYSKRDREAQANMSQLTIFSSPTTGSIFKDWGERCSNVHNPIMLFVWVSTQLEVLCFLKNFTRDNLHTGFGKFHKASTHQGLPMAGSNQNTGFVSSKLSGHNSLYYYLNFSR